MFFYTVRRLRRPLVTEQQAECAKGRVGIEPNELSGERGRRVHADRNPRQSGGGVGDAGPHLNAREPGASRGAKPLLRSAVPARMTLIVPPQRERRARYAGAATKRRDGSATPPKGGQVPRLLCCAPPPPPTRLPPMDRSPITLFEW